MGIVHFSRYEWVPSPTGNSKIDRRYQADIAISLARVILVNGLASIANNRYGSYESLRLEAQLLATMLTNSHAQGHGALRRARAFDCSSLHLQSFAITSAGLGLLTASIESLLIQGKLRPFQITQFDLLPASTRRGSGKKNERPDLLINLPNNRIMVGEAKGRRRGSTKVTKAKISTLDKLYRWASTSPYKGCPLLMSWASILEKKTIVDLFHTPPNIDVDPYREEEIIREEDRHPSRPQLGEQPPYRFPPLPITPLDWDDLLDEDDLLNDITVDSSPEMIQDLLFLSAPELPEPYSSLANVPIRGSWVPLESNPKGRSMFVGVFREEPDEVHKARLRRAYVTSVAENYIAPLDVAAQGRLVFALAQDAEFSTWGALRQAIQ
ncbi:hypothetical protein AB0L53_42670 [Nonomuraea sp. NPDC052129]|uniref:hypothetical protein n=1 Tax=Nonomuraea sp. NPDC052129 TaxID=3154651 RepID=UPI0034497001